MTVSRGSTTTTQGTEYGYAVRETSHSVCKICARGWPAPRNIRYMYIASGAKEIEHQTKDCVVAFLSVEPEGKATPSIHPDVFRRLTFAVPPGWDTLTYHRSGNLVQGFHYDRLTGDVSYGEQRVNDAYARLITLNAWWNYLFKAIISVGLSFFDLATTTSFCIALVSDKQLVEEFAVARWAFIIVWALAILAILWFSVDEAAKEWRIRAHARIGDITKMPSWLETQRTFAALIAFVFFSTETLVRDIVISLHPWKGMQPYAAIKFDGTRAFVLGYQSDEHFVIWNWAGQSRVLIAKLFAQFAIITFKAVMLYASMGHSLTLAWNCCTTLFSFALTLRKFYKLTKARSMYRQSHPEVFQKVLGHGRSVKATSTIKVPEGGHHHSEHATILDAQKDQLLWRERVFILRNFATSSTVSRNMSFEDKGVDVCVSCRRHKQPPEWYEAMKTSFNKGQLVRLLDNGKLANHHYGDAPYGPLQPGDIGEVLEVVWALGHGGRARVKLVATIGDPTDHSDDMSGVRAVLDRRGSSVTIRMDEQTFWWYDVGALTIINAEASEAYKIAVDMSCGVEDMGDPGANDTDACVDVPEAQATPQESPGQFSITVSQPPMFRGWPMEEEGLDDYMPPSKMTVPDDLPLTSAADFLAQWTSEIERLATSISTRLDAEVDQEVKLAVNAVLGEQVGPSLLRVATMLAPSAIPSLHKPEVSEATTQTQSRRSPRVEKAVEASVAWSVEELEELEQAIVLRKKGARKKENPNTPRKGAGITVSSSMTAKPTRLTEQDIEFFQVNAAVTRGHSKSLSVSRPSVPPSPTHGQSASMAGTLPGDPVWELIKQVQGPQDGEYFGHTSSLSLPPPPTPPATEALMV